jgi:DNA-binding NtrC family response regulator
MVPAEIVSGRDPVLLVVEDEVLIRLSVCDFLRDEGFTVIEAGNADDALAVLNVRGDIALVLTDLNMSGAMEGVRLIREIRRSYPAIKVITASAYQVTEPVEATITKPYSLDRLLAIIKSVLDL